MIRPQLRLKRVEWLLAILLSALTILTLAVRATQAGALWRDDCAVVQLAGMPSVSDVLGNFQHEAFPPLFPLIVRIYTVVFGSSDTALRIFGFCVGCLVIGAFWVNSRLFRPDVPLVALALTSLNTTFFVWGTTIRGYGLGSAMIVLIFGCLGSMLLAEKRQRFITVALICFFGVQILLYNGVLLIAVAASAIAILLVQSRSKQAFVVFTICVVAMLSLLPYVPAYLRARDWNILVRGWPTSYSLWKHFELALGNPGYSIPALWYAIAGGLGGIFLFQLRQNRSGEKESRLIWFAILASGMSVTGCYGLLPFLS